MDENKTTILYGVNPVGEALKAGKRTCYKIVVPEESAPTRVQSLIQLAGSQKTPLEKLPKAVFKQKYHSFLHQGIVGYFSKIEPVSLDQLIQQAFKKTPQPTLVILDGIQDPQNLGAIIRSAEVFGVSGMVLPKRGSSPLNETVAKCSSGGIENILFARATNLTEAIKQLKKEKFWVVGVDLNGEMPCYDFKFDVPIALVIGGEGKGIRPLLRKHCDTIVSIPMAGKLDSLNVSAASAVVFYEIYRQANR